MAPQVPPPPQTAPPPPPGAPAAAPPPVAPSGPVDPHQLGLAVGRLGSAAKRQGKVAFVVASALLQDGEIVEALVQGHYEGQPGVAVLTQHRVLLVNEAEWKAGTASVDIEPSLTVQGWQDDKVASLIFESAGRQVTIDAIDDRALAQEIAGRVRAKVAEAGGGAG